MIDAELSPAMLRSGTDRGFSTLTFTLNKAMRQGGSRRYWISCPHCRLSVKSKLRIRTQAVRSHSYSSSLSQSSFAFIVSLFFYSWISWVSIRTTHCQLIQSRPPGVEHDEQSIIKTMSSPFFIPTSYHHHQRNIIFTTKSKSCPQTRNTSPAPSQKSSTSSKSKTSIRASKTTEDPHPGRKLDFEDSLLGEAQDITLLTRLGDLVRQSKEWVAEGFKFSFCCERCSTSYYCNGREELRVWRGLHGERCAGGLWPWWGGGGGRWAGREEVMDRKRWKLRLIVWMDQRSLMSSSRNEFIACGSIFQWWRVL